MSTTAAVLRAAELEAQLSLERTENARRLREVEPRIQEFRAALQSMHQKLKSGGTAQARLEARVEAADGEIADLRRALEGPRPDAAVASGELAAAREEIRRLTEMLAEMEASRGDLAPAGAADAHMIERLSNELRKRDQALIAAAEKLKAQERDIASLDRKLGFARSKAAEIRDELLAAKRAAGDARASQPALGASLAPAAAAPRDAAADDVFPSVPGIRIEAATGSHGLGARFFAREAEGRRPVGVIVFSRPLTETDSKRLDAMRVARHPNITTAVAFGMSPAGPYVAFERAFGETAGEWVRRIGPLPERTALPLCLQIARGLRHAAFHGVLHGDLSPAVVRIEPTGTARVEDVGLGALHAGADRPALAPLFASPERLRGSPPPDERSDIYSLGAMLFFLLTGRVPFEGDRAQLTRRQAAGPPPDPRERSPGVSAAAARLVMRCMAHDPSRRPLTWDEALIEIERLASGQRDTQESAPRRRIAAFVGGHPLFASCIAATPILAAAAFLYVTMGYPPSPRERFQAVVLKADALAASGDVEGACLILSRFLGDTGDASVEREASARLDKLRGK